MEKVSYSRDGIHPQCAMIQADEPRKQQLKAKEKIELEKTPVAKKPSPAWNQKKCPKCGVEASVRKKNLRLWFRLLQILSDR